MTMSVICITTLSFMALAPADEERQVLQAIRIAYEANRSAPGFGTIHFSFAVASAADPEAARRGDLVSSFATEGLYAYDGKKVRYDCVFSLQDEVAARVKTTKDSYTSFIDSRRFITNGKLTLYDGIGVGGDDRTVSHSAQISSAMDVYFRGTEVPLELGAPRPRGHFLDKDIASLQSGKADWKLTALEEDARLEGLHLVGVAFESPTEDLHYWVDLEHGAVPRKVLQTIKSESGAIQTKIQIYYDDLRHVAKKSWVPFRKTVFVSTGRVRQFTILNADFETPPPTTTFRMEFPAERALINAVTLVKYAPQKVWDLDHLPTATDPKTRRIEVAQPGPPAPAMPGPRAAGAWVPTTLALVGGLFLLIAARIAYRRVRHG